MNIGILVVITGASGAGKDAVMEGFLKNSNIQKLKLMRVVTCADRSPRPGEVDGREYHFVTPEKLREMEKAGELVEPITLYGTSNKATPKSEIERLLNGENLVWRIDPSRSAEIAEGKFFQKLFATRATELMKHTLVIFVTAPRDEIIERRKKRDLDKYNPSEYLAREEQEALYVKILKEKAVVINNLNGKLDYAVAETVKRTLKFNESLSNNKE